MSTYRLQFFWGRRRRNKHILCTSVLLPLAYQVPTMSSRQHSDFQYEQFQAAWLAAQNGSQLNVGGGLGSFQGARHGERYPSEFGQFNRSSIPLAVQPSATGDSVGYILHVIAQADHDMLLRSGNEAYSKALESHKGTKEELASLK